MPLIEVSSGDIAEQASATLDIFLRLLAKANRWRAILSLENAELLFSRSKQDLEERDYIMLPMIEALEAHRGLLFLVTGRFGALEPALFTRVNFAISLPKLGKESQLKLFWNLARKTTGGDTGSCTARSSFLT
jgi:hypothetical protein